MRIFQSRAWRGLLILSGILLTLAGCASDDDRYKPSSLTDYPAGVSVRTVWRASVGSGSGLGFVPAVVGDAVYAATPDGSVGKFDLLSGRSIWKASAEAKLSAGAGSDGTTTAVASVTGDVVAFDDAGKIKWKTRATSEVSIPPVVGEGVVVVRSGDYRIQAFDARTGDRLWNVQRPGPALALRSGSQMIIVDNLVITGLPGGRLMALNLATGAVQWEGAVAVPRGATDLERLSDVVGSPIMTGRLLCAVAYQGRAACFDVSAGGRLLWGKDFSSASGLTADSRQIYAPDARGVVNAFALDDGTNAWRQAALKNRTLTAPATTGSAVAVGDFEGYLHFLSAADGRLLARLSLGGGAILSPLLTTSQGVLAQTGNGELVMVAATN
jgi:outer membrane protein assembly factor BamB